MPEPREQFDDAAFMRAEDDWPNWPVLPMKRRQTKGWPELGLMLGNVKSPTGEVTIFLASIFEPVTADTPKLTYPTPEAAVADGWVVD